MVKASVVHARSAKVLNRHIKSRQRNCGFHLSIYLSFDKKDLYNKFLAYFFLFQLEDLGKEHENLAEEHPEDAEDIKKRYEEIMEHWLELKEMVRHLGQ